MSMCTHIYSKAMTSVGGNTVPVYAYEDRIGALTYSGSELRRIDTPNGYISEGATRYCISDHQGNVRQVVDSVGTVLQDNHYYPFGMLMGESSDILEANRTLSALSGNPYRYSGNRLITHHNAHFGDFHARWYDFQTLRFLQPDPFREKYYPLPPYLYCAGNPIMLTDKNGLRIRISGDAMDKFMKKFKELVGPHLTVTADDKGNISYEEKSNGGKMPGVIGILRRIMDDSKIMVDLYATNRHKTRAIGGESAFFIGGSFMGNRISINSDLSISVVAFQDINPTILEKISNATNKPGANLLHEITEAYFGGMISLFKLKNAPRSDKSDIYYEAHSLACPQSFENGGLIPLDISGNVMDKVGDDTDKVILYIIDSNSKIKEIHYYNRDDL